MKVFDSTSDEDLMRAYQGGDSEAFEILFLRNRARVFGFLLKKLKVRSEAEDVFQATFMKLHSSRKLYDPSFKFTPWLFTICQSVLKDHYRTRNRNLEDANEELIEKAPAQQPEAPSISLEALDQSQKAAVEMRYFEDLSFDEIANKLQTSPSSARQLVSRAIRKIRREKDQEDQ